MNRPPPTSSLCPSPTLFRSPLPAAADDGGGGDRVGVHPVYAVRHPLRRAPGAPDGRLDRKSTRLNSSHANISYAVFCLKKKKNHTNMLATFLAASTRRRPLR